MPSAEETTFLIKVMPDANINQDSFMSRDVDVLVSRIKKNLRLSGFKSRSSLVSSQKLRTSPYRLPSRTWAGTCEGCEICSSTTTATGGSVSDLDPERYQQTRRATHHLHHHKYHDYQHHRHRRYRKSNPLDLDDSYERFQALLHSGALIKEAVKRLQTSSDDDLVDDEDSSNCKGRATSTSATSAILDSMDEEEEEDEDEEDDDDKHQRHHFVVRRKHFDYDSEDEPIHVEM